MTELDEKHWRELAAGVDCPLCEPNEKSVIAVLPSGRVEFVADADFVGYCILVHQRHVIELFELTQTEREQFINDISLVAECMKEELQPDKINYEILGNAVPHLHCHIFPRYFQDGYWGGPIWWRPIEKRAWLQDEVAGVIAKSLRERIAVKRTGTQYS